MNELYPYFTNDGSVGLFSPADDDIYHSTYGALTEAYEKFILPMNLKKYFSAKTNIKILDICYGIGYNSKSFLDYFLYEIFNTNNTTETIYSDNISKIKKLQNYNIYIKAIDTDKTLAYLSPFIVTGKKIPKDYKLPFHEERIEKLLRKQSANKNSNKSNSIVSNDKKSSSNKNTSRHKFLPFIKAFNLNYSHLKKISNLTNIIILQELIQNITSYLVDNDLCEVLNSEKYIQFLDKHIIRIFNFERNSRYKYTLLMRLFCFLHNIYYNHISTSYKNASKCLKTGFFKFDLNIQDARSVLLSDDNTYNFVFLDAFTPAKCPCLWTVDFFKLLYSHLDSDGVVLTYSNSASVRNAFIQAGFYVGKIFNPSAGKFMGTIASKNKDIIENKLTEYDLGLIQTRAGIVYRDETLTSSNDEIISRHRAEVESSQLESSSRYIKNSRRNNNV